jgi:hypothetical protein
MTVKSQKHQRREPFQPFKRPTPKVREAWSRIAGTLSASAYAGAFIVADSDIEVLMRAVKVSALFAIGGIMTLLAIYVLRGVDRV